MVDCKIELWLTRFLDGVMLRFGFEHVGRTCPFINWLYLFTIWLNAWRVRVKYVYNKSKIVDISDAAARRLYIEFEYTHGEFSMWWGRQRCQRCLVYGGYILLEIPIKFGWTVHVTYSNWITFIRFESSQFIVPIVQFISKRPTFCPFQNCFIVKSIKSGGKRYQNPICCFGIFNSILFQVQKCFWGRLI